MKKLLSNYFICLIIGGATFWGCYGLVKVMTGLHYGGKSVGFLTLFAPFVTWIVIWKWYNKILPKNKRGIMAAIFIGIVGPFIMTWLYSVVIIAIPAAKMAQLVKVKDYLSFIGMSLIIGPLSLLTYTGMLGAMMLNIISSPIIGWWVSKQINNT